MTYAGICRYLDNFFNDDIKPSDISKMPKFDFYDNYELNLKVKTIKDKIEKYLIIFYV